ncbi:hypothetical protein ACHAWF_001845 [Thalassiosira exigua]
MPQNSSLSIGLSPQSARPGRGRGGGDDRDERAGAALTIRCLPELTPLDMMDMAFGRADPTGSCVWLGAFLFLEVFARDVEEAPPEVVQLRRALFPPGCRALELGAGTGMSGLSLMAHSVRDALLGRRGTSGGGDCGRREGTCVAGPSLLVQTDINDDCLELCRINRDANLGRNGRECVRVTKLEWGKGNASKVFGRHCEDAPTQTNYLPARYDVVFATDVLYDLSSLVPLVTTASELLEEGGYFILSHVPRASIDDHDQGTLESNDFWQRLESIIINEASKTGLVLAQLPPSDNVSGKNVCKNMIISSGDGHNGQSHMILRPTLLPVVWNRSSPLSHKHSWTKMIDVGAAILVFEKH